MAERKADIVVGNPTGTASGIIPISSLSREERRARRAQVLDRGSAGDRLQVQLPAGMYGEWFHNSAEEIHRAQALGFEIDTVYAPKRALHSDGTDKSIVGDVIYMTCDAETKEDIDFHRKMQFEKIHGKPGVKRSAAEEREYSAQMEKNPQIPAINTSATHSVTGDEIAASVKAST